MLDTFVCKSIKSDAICLLVEYVEVKSGKRKRGEDNNQVCNLTVLHQEAYTLTETY